MFWRRAWEHGMHGDSTIAVPGLTFSTHIPALAAADERYLRWR
jgi:hypothetical protein